MIDQGLYHYLAVQRKGTGLKAEHVVEAESAVAAHEPVVAEETAGCVADRDVGTSSRTGAAGRIESFMIIP